MINYSTFEITHGMPYLTACRFLEEYMSRLWFKHDWGTNVTDRLRTVGGEIKGKNNTYVSNNWYNSNFFRRFLSKIDSHIPYSMYVDIDNFDATNHTYPTYTENTAYAKLGETKIPITVFGNLYDILTQRLRIMRLLKYRSFVLNSNTTNVEWLQKVYSSMTSKYRNDSYKVESNPANYSTFYAEEWSRLTGWLNANICRDGDIAEVAAPGGGFLASFSITHSPNTNPVFCATKGHLVNNYFDFSWHIGDIYTSEVWVTRTPYNGNYTTTLMTNTTEYKTHTISGVAKNNYSVFPEGTSLGMTQGFADGYSASVTKQTFLSGDIIRISPEFCIDAQTNFDSLMPNFYT